MADRIGDYYLNCEMRIAEAKKCLEKMKSAENMIEVRANFMVFLDLTKNLFFPLQKYKNRLDDYDVWWGTHLADFDNEVCNFFKHARNDVIKGAYEIIKWNAIHPKGESIHIQGPLMLYEGNVFQPLENGRWVPHQEVVGVNLDWEFIDSPLNNNPIGLCSRYIEILENILADFINTYPDILSR